MGLRWFEGLGFERLEPSVLKQSARQFPADSEEYYAYGRQAYSTPCEANIRNANPEPQTQRER